MQLPFLTQTPYFINSEFPFLISGQFFHFILLPFGFLWRKTNKCIYVGLSDKFCTSLPFLNSGLQVFSFLFGSHRWFVKQLKSVKKPQILPYFYLVLCEKQHKIDTIICKYSSMLVFKCSLILKLAFLNSVYFYNWAWNNFKDKEISYRAEFFYIYLVKPSFFSYKVLTLT